MARDISAQIIAKAWSDDHFAQALRGPNAYAAIRDALGVSLPTAIPLPEIPPAPGSKKEGGIHSGIRAGVQIFELQIESPKPGTLVIHGFYFPD